MNFCALFISEKSVKVISYFLCTCALKEPMQIPESAVLLCNKDYCRAVIKTPFACIMQPAHSRATIAFDVK